MEKFDDERLYDANIEDYVDYIHWTTVQWPHWNVGESDKHEWICGMIKWNEWPECMNDRKI